MAALSPSEFALVVGQQISVWAITPDCSNLEMKHQLTLEEEDLTTACFADEKSKTLAVANATGAVLFVELASGKVKRRVALEEERVITCMHFWRGNYLMLSTLDGFVFFYDTNTLM